MNSRERQELARHARALGVQTEFIDCAGRRKQASAEALRAIIELLGEEEEDASPFPPVVVCWNGKPKSVAIKTQPGLSRTRISLFPLPRGALHKKSRELVSREEREVGKRPDSFVSFPLFARLSVLSFCAKHPGGEGQGAGERDARIIGGFDSSALVKLPSLPFGYYELRVAAGGREHRTLVISAPRKAFAPRAMRDWGIFLPMYAAQSQSSWGAGNFSDWKKICESLPNKTVAATLPLLGAFCDEWKCDCSPYSPATRLFWNEFYVDVQRVPEFATNRATQRLVKSAAFQREINSLHHDRLVNYPREMSLKRRVLEHLAAEFFRGNSLRREQFEKFLGQRPEIKRYAAFRAACERQQRSWQSWPERSRRGTLRGSDYDPATARYCMFVQWLAQSQMDEVLAACRARDTKFYLDLPLGVNPDGYDVWANQHLFVTGASVGAPPDAFFTKGQDWGFPPLHPRRVREDHYRYVIDYLRFQMRHTGLLRLDHVMGLHRLWWVPRGASAADGAYVSYNAEELYAILCLESHRHQTMLVGENLGTVPPEVNRSMKRHGLRSMFVVQYETNPDAKETLRTPPRDCVASINTHDMPMWAAHWRGLDIADRQALGLINAHEAREEKQRRSKLRRSLAEFLRRKKLLSGPANAKSVLNALLKFLSRSEAELVLVNLEDMWLETDPQNTPGTLTERVNWRRKARRPVESLDGVLRILNALMKERG